MSNTFTAQRYKGVTCNKKLFEPGAAEWVSVKKDAKEVDSLFADNHTVRKANSFALNITEKIDVILSIEWWFSSDHFKQDGSNTPKVCFSVISEGEVHV